MNSVDQVSRCFAKNKEIIPSFGKNHFILSVIPVVSLIVERAMFMRAEAELLEEMTTSEQITLVDEMHLFKDISTITKFSNNREAKFFQIAGWHLATGLFQLIPWALMFGVSPLPRACFALLYASHVMLLAESSKLSITYDRESQKYVHLSHFTR